MTPSPYFGQNIPIGAQTSAAAPQTKGYKQHSVASALWGDIPVTDRPIRQPGREESQETFLRGVLETPLEKDQRNPMDLGVSVLIHIALLAALLIVPLMFTDVLDIRSLEVTYLEVPKPPAPAPAPTPPEVRKTPHVLRVIPLSQLKAPSVIPKKVEIAKDENAPTFDQGGVVGGIAGGEGLLGGILGGTGAVPPPPPPPAAKPKPELVRVGGDVKPPQLLVHVDPKYPRIAITSHIEGIVVIDAIIDENGNVVEGKAISGPVLLYQSALDAVKQWKYAPTLLNGDPVSIAMHVQVVYHLRSDTE